MGSSTAFGSSDVEDGLEAILSLLSSMRGLDFTLYRRSTLRRRVRRRMERSQMPTINAYVQFMKEWPAELEALSQDILVNATHFFRGPEVFDVLKAKVYPELFKAFPQSAPIRIWVPGCSTGEEVYSIAMSLIEALTERQLRIPIQIFATDVSDGVIAKARAGMYGDDIAAHVTKQRRARFFTSYGERWQINRSIREMCVFARQDVMTDPPFSRLDLISCRNMLIQWEPPLEERLLPTFHYALKPAGVLLLGAPWKGTDLFTAIETNHGIYKRVDPAAHGSAAPIEDRLSMNRELRSEQQHLVVEIAQELEVTKESLLGLIDEQEVINEELQTTNTDLASTNEELQSINEELQAIGEEIRAANADLSAMNEMLERDNDDLSRLTEHLTNVLGSLDFPIVTLSRDLRVRWLTPPAKQVLELTRADVGRGLGDLERKLEVPGLERVAAEVLAMGSRPEREVKVKGGRLYSLRILPCRNKERGIDGVVLFFVEINAGKVEDTLPGA